MRRRMIFAQPDQAEADTPPAIAHKPDWQSLHWKRQVKLARDMGADVASAIEARSWLEGHA